MALPAYAGRADGWSVDFEFEEEEIEIDGVFVGFFAGTAELVEDRDGFHVGEIAVTARKRETDYRWGYERFTYSNTVLILPHPKDDDQSFKAFLYREIEKRILENPRAREFFHAEQEQA